MKKFSTTSLLIVFLGVILFASLFSKRLGVEGFKGSRKPTDNYLKDNNNDGGWTPYKPREPKTIKNNEVCKFNYECLSQNCAKGKCAPFIKCNTDKDCQADTSKCSKEIGQNYDYNCYNRNKNKCVNKICTSFMPKNSNCISNIKVSDGQTTCCFDDIGDMGCRGDYINLM
jgi:hypothetical protein